MPVRRLLHIIIILLLGSVIVQLTTNDVLLSGITVVISGEGITAEGTVEKYITFTMQYIRRGYVIKAFYNTTLYSVDCT